MGWQYHKPPRNARGAPSPATPCAPVSRWMNARANLSFRANNVCNAVSCPRINVPQRVPCAQSRKHKHRAWHTTRKATRKMAFIWLKSKTLTESPRQWNSSVTWPMEVGLSLGKSKVSIPFTMIGCARKTTLSSSRSLRSPPMHGPAFLRLTWQLTMQPRFGLAMQIAKMG